MAYSKGKACVALRENNLMFLRRLRDEIDRYEQGHYLDICNIGRKARYHFMWIEHFGNRRVG